MSNYYVMRSNPNIESQRVPGYIEIEDWENAEEFEGWSFGVLAQRRPVGPVELRAVPHEGFIGVPDEFSDSNIPLVSARLKAVLDDIGVNNINYFPVTLVNPNNNDRFDYFAFNLVGLVAAVDIALSDLNSHDGDFVGDSQIYNLVIDDAKCNDLLMFRLKEKFSVILVHRTVKEAIERAGVTSVKFVKPEDFFAL